MITALFAMLLVQEAPATPPAERPQPPKCEGEIYEAFDFWVGEWDVYGPDGKKQANSRIEKVSSGCAIRETWMPLTGGDGSSMTAYDPKTATWEQVWVGQLPGPILFEGGPVDDRMILTGYWGKTAEGKPNLVRMTYSTLDGGSVRQYGQASSDHGLTWSDYFDLTYRKKDD